MDPFAHLLAELLRTFGGASTEVVAGSPSGQLLFWMARPPRSRALVAFDPAPAEVE